jgi:hypothetical protein
MSQSLSVPLCSPFPSWPAKVPATHDLNAGQVFMGGRGKPGHDDASEWK